VVISESFNPSLCSVSPNVKKAVCRITYQMADGFERRLRDLGFDLDNYFTNMKHRPRGRECGEYVDDFMAKLDRIAKEIMALRR